MLLKQSLILESQIMMWLGISSKVDQNKSPFFDMVTLNWGSKSMHFFKAGNQYPGVTPSAILTLRMFQELNLKKKKRVYIS